MEGLNKYLISLHNKLKMMSVIMIREEVAHPYLRIDTMDHNSRDY